MMQTDESDAAFSCGRERDVEGCPMVREVEGMSLW